MRFRLLAPILAILLLAPAAQAARAATFGDIDAALRNYLAGKAGFEDTMNYYAQVCLDIGTPEVVRAAAVEARCDIALDEGEDAWAMEESSILMNSLPDTPSNHYIAARIMADHKAFAEASEAIEEAVALCGPSNPHLDKYRTWRDRIAAAANPVYGEAVEADFAADPSAARRKYFGKDLCYVGAFQKAYRDGKGGAVFQLEAGGRGRFLASVPMGDVPRVPVGEGDDLMVYGRMTGTDGGFHLQGNVLPPAWAK